MLSTTSTDPRDAFVGILVGKHGERSRHFACGLTRRPAKRRLPVPLSRITKKNGWSARNTISARVAAGRGAALSPRWPRRPRSPSRSRPRTPCGSRPRGRVARPSYAREVGRRGRERERHAHVGQRVLELERRVDLEPRQRDVHLLAASRPASPSGARPSASLELGQASARFGSNTTIECGPLVGELQRLEAAAVEVAEPSAAGS